MQQWPGILLKKITGPTFVVSTLLLLAGNLPVSAVAAESGSLAASSCNAAQLQGSWELQSAIYRDSQGKVVGEINNQQTKSRKLIAGRYFSFMTWQADGSFVVAASGQFTTDAQGYHEQIDATSLPKLQNKTYHFQCRINGNNWLHQGLEDGIEIEEHWQRVSGA